MRHELTIRYSAYNEHYKVHCKCGWAINMFWKDALEITMMHLKERGYSHECALYECTRAMECLIEYLPLEVP